MMSKSEQIDIRRQFDRLLAVSPAVIYVCGPGPNFTTTFISDNVSRTLGYQPVEFYEEPGFWNRHLHPEDRERVIGKFIGLNAERPLVVEYRFRHHNGDYVWLRDEVMLQSTAGGNISGLTGTWFDITERKRFELELIEKERKYSSLFHDFNDAVIIHDLEGTILDINRKALKLFGYSRAELKSLKVADLHPAEALAESAAAFEKIKKRGAISGEVVFKRKDGTEFPAEFSASLVKIGEEEVVQAIVRDITERKLSEEKLRRSEARNKAMLEAIPDLMFHLNAAGVFLGFHGNEDLLYVAPEAFIGRVVEEVLPDQVAAVTRLGLSEALRTGGPYCYEYELPIAGEIQHFECRMVPCEKDEVLAIVRNITERKQADLRLRHSEERYRSVFESIRDGLVITDSSSKINFVNTAACEILGLEAHRLLGQDLAMLLDKDGCADLAAVRRELEKSPVCRCELQFTRQDGSRRQLSLSAAPYQDSRGESEGLVVIIVDVTEEKLIAEERRELRDKLATAQRMESLGVLAGGVAHDLNNILGPLVGYPQLIREYLPSDSPILDQVITIEKSARRAADVVKDLLTLARRGRYEMEPLRMNQILQSILESPEVTSALTRSPQINVDLDLAEELPFIHGSTPHLSKALTNLTLNAIDAMPEGGSLRIRTRCSYLERLIGGFDNIIVGRYVIVSIADSGMGIPTENLKRIFEPFYSTKRMGRSGSGLGLAVVYGVVKDHNGYVDVVSEVGQGAEFLIYLPIVDSLQITEKPVEAAGIWGEARILVVDDLEEQRQLAQTLLGSIGYQVETVSNGREAVEYVREHDVDLVILDMILEPEYDGLTTYNELLRYKPEQRAIIVSGHAETVRVRQALKLGVSSFLRKPYTLQQLGLALREALAGQRESSPKQMS